jgi:hypothetical protein
VSAPTPPAWCPVRAIAQPPYPVPAPDERFLLDALAGVELGEYDRASARHLAWFLSPEVFAVLVSWVYRVRGVQ